MGELLQLLGNPAPEDVVADLAAHNALVRDLAGLELPANFTTGPNTWDVRLNDQSGHWTIAAPAAGWELGENAAFVFLRRGHTDDTGHVFWEAVDEFDADLEDGRRCTLAGLKHDHQAWLT